MTFRDWSSSNLHYGRKLVDSGLEGARRGEQEFLQGDRLRAFVGESLRNAIAPAAIGAFLALLSGPRRRSRSAARALAYGVAGGALGFGIGVIWQTRSLAASVAGSAMRDIGKARDEHWLERHPIDYA